MAKSSLEPASLGQDHKRVLAKLSSREEVPKVFTDQKAQETVMAIGLVRSKIFEAQEAIASVWLGNQTILTDEEVQKVVDGVTEPYFASRKLKSKKKSKGDPTEKESEPPKDLLPSVRLSEDTVANIDSRPCKKQKRDKILCELDPVYAFLEGRPG